MTPDELRAIRTALGLTTAALATALGLGKDGGRTVRRWERGDRAISGPVALAVRSLAAEMAARKTNRCAAPEPSP